MQHRWWLSKCQQKTLGWGIPAERFACTRVEFLGDVFEAFSPALRPSRSCPMKPGQFGPADEIRDEQVK